MGSGSEGVCIQGSASGGLGRLSPLDTMGYSQKTGSTHPTGMHFCSFYFLFIVNVSNVQDFLLENFVFLPKITL